MDANELSDADASIVTALADSGNLTKGALVDTTDYSRNTVYTRLEVLQAAGIVECIHERTRLFTLAATPDGWIGGSPFVRTRRSFNRLDPDDVDAFVAATAANGGGIKIQLDAKRDDAGIARQYALLAVYLRALASVLDTSVEDVLRRCVDSAGDIEFDDRSPRDSVLEEAG